MKGLFHLREYEPQGHHSVVQADIEQWDDTTSGSASSELNNPDYVPNLNMGYHSTSLTTPEAKRERFHRAQRRVDDRAQKEIDLHQKEDAASILLELSLNTATMNRTPERQEERENGPSTISDIHDPCLQKILRLQTENKQLLEEVGTLQKELRETRQKLEQNQFGDSILAGDKKDARTVFYTGVKNHAMFLFLVQFCTSVLPTSMQLRPASVLMLVLMKLRLGLVNQDLAYRFGVSKQHVSDLLNNALPPLAQKLSCFIHWPEKDDVVKYMPKVIKNCYKQCRVIIDCFEVFIERPGNFTARAMTWSNYKSHNTVKVLVGICPNGSITFVSRAFGGRVSDKVITQRSGFLQLLEHGDLVLADRGFLIAGDLSARGAQLAIPAFTKGKAQLSPKEIETGRRLSRVRIHVERAIERLKNYKILSTTMKINMVPHADSIITICSAITNLLPPLVE
ncbi:uncharacterized protein [Haliotis cracherodii]|uniref:uncharacterized protein n=1 Tax=Haliotis cracherodii TaxID=6455 RepID=UPI0039E7A075